MKHLKKIMLAVGVGFLALSGAVLSQVITLPQVSILNPTDLIQIIVKGQPTAQSQYVAPQKISNTPGYYKSPASQPTSSFLYTFANNVSYASFTPSGTIAYGYIALNAAPSDGTRNCMFSTQTITTLYVCVTSTGPTNCVTTNLNAAVTTLAANATACYIYSASNQNWDRSQ